MDFFKTKTAMLILSLLFLLVSSAFADTNTDEAAKVPTATEVSAAEDDNWDDDWDDENGYDFEPPKEHTYSLERCIQTALQNNPGIKAAHWDVIYYNAKADEAWWAWFPQIRYTTLLTAAPDYDPPPISDPKKFLAYSQKWYEFDGVVWANQIDLTQPLYTFGKVGAIRAMGPLAKQAGFEQEEVAKNRIIVEVKRAYYTLQLIEKMLDVLDEGMAYVKSAESKLNELLNSNSESVTEIDKYKFDVVKADLLSRVEEAKRNQLVVLSALHMLLDIPAGQEFYLDRRFPKIPSTNPTATFGDKTEISQTMLDNRPELKLLEVQLDLKQKQYDLQRGFYFPDIFIQLQYKYVTTPEMQNISSPYLSDPYNTHYLAFFIGLTYKFDLPLQVARVKQAEAKLNKAEQIKKFYTAQMKLELESAYQTYIEKLKQIDISATGEKSGRKWIITALMNYNIGLLESSDMVESIAAYFKTQFYYYAAVHSALIAGADLEFKQGNALEASKMDTKTAGK